MVLLKELIRKGNMVKYVHNEILFPSADAK